MMLQTIKFNGNNINGTQGNRIGNTVAAGCDLSVERFDLGKPLSKPSNSHVTVRSYPTLTMGRRPSMLHQLMQHAVPATGVPVAKPAALEPPAAAWASFVISRTTSV